MNKPITHLVSIAISKYPHIYVGDLPNAVNDSQKLIHSFKKYQVSLFEQALENEAATLENIHGLFNRLSKAIKSKAIKEEDSLLISINGHGKLHNDELYLLLSESYEENRSTWYSFHDMFAELKVMTNNHIVLLVNCCYSGNLLQRPYSNTHAKKHQSRILFAAGGIDQKVQDAHPKYSENSAFAYHICQTLDGCNDYKLPLRKIISDTVAAFEETDYGSKPAEYHFAGHGGAEFYFNSEQDEPKAWNEAEQQHTIEAYKKYRWRFREGANAPLAIQRINDLKDELKAWKECNQQLRDVLNEFVPSFVSKFNPKFANRANRVCQCLAAQYEKLTEIDRAEIAWREIEKSDNPQFFLKLSADFANTEYAIKAQNMIPILEAKRQEKEDWEQTQKRAAPKAKRGHYSYYLQQHKQEKKAYIASRKIKEIDLFIKATSEKADEVLALKELESYWIEFPRGEYKHQVKRLKEFFQRKQDLNNAISETDIDKVIEIVAQIEGLNQTEQKTHNELAAIAKNYIHNYENGIKKEAIAIIKQGDIPTMYHFVKIHENNADKHVKKTKRKMDEIDYQQFQKAEEAKTTEGYDSYLSLFKLYGGNYCEKAEERKIEIEYFHKYKSPEEFQAYLKQKDCLFKLEAELQLQLLERQARKQKAYDDFVAEPTIPNSNLYYYYKECLEQDEQSRFVDEKTKNLKREADAKQLYDEIKAEIIDFVKRRALCLTYLKDYSDMNENDYLEIQEIKDTLEHDDELAAFLDAHKQNTVKGWLSYLHDDRFPKPPDNIRHAEKMIKDLTALSKEQNDYDALCKGTYNESAYIAFLKEYPNPNGRFYKDVFDRIFKKQHTMTDEEKSVADKWETTNKAIGHLSTHMDTMITTISAGFEKLIPQNTMTVEEKKVANPLEKTNDGIDNLSTRIDDMTITLSDGFEKLIHQNRMSEHEKSIVDKLEKTNEGIDNLSTRIDAMTTTLSDGFEKLKTHQTEQTNQANDNIKDHFKTMANQTQDHFKQFAENSSKNAEANHAHTDNLARILATRIDDLNSNQKIWAETALQNGQAQTDKIAKVLADGLKDLVNHHKENAEQTKEHSEAQTKKLLVHFEETNQNQFTTTKDLIQNLVKTQQEQVDTFEQNAVLHREQIGVHFKQLNESQIVMSNNIEMLYKSIENLVETQNKIANNAAQNTHLQNEALLNNLSANVAQSIDKLVINQQSIKETGIAQNIEVQSVLKKLETNHDKSSNDIKEQNALLIQNLNKNDKTLDETLKAIKSNNKLNLFFIGFVILSVIGLIVWLYLKTKNP
jgi:hypothetical protein